MKALLREDEDASANTGVVLDLQDRQGGDGNVVESLVPEERAKVTFDLADQGSRRNQIHNRGNLELAHQSADPPREDEGLASRSRRRHRHPCLIANLVPEISLEPVDSKKRVPICRDRVLISSPRVLDARGAWEAGSELRLQVLSLLCQPDRGVVGERIEYEGGRVLLHLAGVHVTQASLSDPEGCFL